MTKGIVRAIDGIGRIVIPKELLRRLKVNGGDYIAIETDRQGRIILTPCKLQCVTCGSTGGEHSLLKEVNGVHMCHSCIAKFLL